MIGRSISIIPSVPADDHCNICMTQSRQLICLLQVRFPSGELLRFGFCCIRHTMKVLPQLGEDGLESRLWMGSIEWRYSCLICVDKHRGLECLPSKITLRCLLSGANFGSSGSSNLVPPPFLDAPLASPCWPHGSQKTVMFAPWNGRRSGQPLLLYYLDFCWLLYVLELSEMRAY